MRDRHCPYVFQQLRKPLTAIMQDTSAKVGIREIVITTLTLITFTSSEYADEAFEVMCQVERLLRGRGSDANDSGDSASLQSVCIESWGILATLAEPPLFDTLVDTAAAMLPNLCRSHNAKIRLASSSIVAIIMELTRDSNNFDDYVRNFGPIVLAIEEQYLESSKSTSKNNRKLCNQMYRNVLRTINGEAYHDFVNFQTVQFANPKQNLELDTWIMKVRYDTLCNTLQGAMNMYLTHNSLLRDIFDLGEPVLSEPAKANVKQDKKANAAAYKARTKQRAKNRDKRTAQF